jgi:hypothetical protein
VNLRAWFLDISIEETGIRFLLCRRYTIHHLRIENIESITKVGRFYYMYSRMLDVLDLQNRFLAQPYLIKTKRGWFARKILVTPDERDDILEWAREHGINR